MGDDRRPELEGEATDEALLATAFSLSAGVRVLFDPATQGYVLVERGRAFVLNGTAAAIVLRCTGERTLGAIVEALAGEHDEPARVLREVLAFVRELLQRGLLETREPRS
ncbi:MAG: pyrroloquinoline quinone biosynthesis peptide chaperone PqqD [Pseudomonadota bacterium]